MQLTIMLSKEVPDEAAANVIVTLVKEKLVDHPEIAVSANLSTPIQGGE